MRWTLGDVNLLACLVMVTSCITEIHCVLKPTGSFYLHCDLIDIVLLWASRGVNLDSLLEAARSRRHSKSMIIGFSHAPSSKRFQSENMWPGPSRAYFLDVAY